MITVTMTECEKKVVGFQITGHANRGEYGEDVVCAAVSAVVQTAILGITDVLKLEAGVSISEGDTTCILAKDTTDAELEQAQIVFFTMLKGLESIALSSPRTLKIRMKEV